MMYYEIPAVADAPSTRPQPLPEHLPYYCHVTGKIRIDRLPVTLDEVRECQAALSRMYAITHQRIAG